ncbi:MAG: thioredoxin domain-containing protein, partial [Gammaproteobacteria bacterium]|nr:thioredoxin domain-containing protein [Gammaproteobacteria bacterium]
SGISTIVAYGGICAHRQDHFWSYHDLAFDEQARLDNESALELARALDLDLDAFKACLGSAQTIRAVAASRQVGKSLGVSLTPGIFVNGRPFMTDALWDHLETLIQIKKQQRESRAALRKRLEAVEANRQSNNQ